MPDILKYLVVVTEDGYERRRTYTEEFADRQEAITYANNHTTSIACGHMASHNATVYAVVEEIDGVSSDGSQTELRESHRSLHK